MRIFSLSALLLPACALGPAEEDTGTFGEGFAVSDLPSSGQHAEGTGVSGHWEAWRRADNSCSQTGGSRAEDCEVDFTLVPTDDGGLGVAFTNYEPASVSEENALVSDLAMAGALPVGTAGSAVTTRVGNTARYWDVSLQAAGDTLTMTLSGRADNMGRCSGDRYTLYCTVSWSDPSLAEHLSPARTLAELGAGALAVTEVLADPTACSDNNAEWVEVENRSGGRVDLAGLVLVDAAGNRSTVDGSLVVEDGGLVVIGRGALASFCDPSVHPDLGSTGTLSLNNGGDSVSLQTGSLTLDSVSYGSMRAGVAWARDEGGAWCEGTPSPGDLNADCPSSGSDGGGSDGGGSDGGATRTVLDLRAGDLYVSEVMLDPAAVSDSAGEWFEVTNPGSTAVDLAGLQVRDLAGTVGTIADHVTLAAGGSAWFGRGSASSWGYGSAPSAWYGSSPALNNSGEQLWLVANGVDIDGTPTLSTSAGVATQRDPSTGAWCAATTTWGSERATPGATNPACR